MALSALSCISNGNDINVGFLSTKTEDFISAKISSRKTARKITFDSINLSNLPCNLAQLSCFVVSVIMFCICCMHRPNILTNFPIARMRWLIHLAPVDLTGLISLLYVSYCCQIVLSISGKGFSFLILFLMNSYIIKTGEEMTHPQDQ